jgi:hypothetical protein
MEGIQAVFGARGSTVLEDTASCDNKDKEEEGKHECLDDDLSVFMRPEGRA